MTPEQARKLLREERRHTIRQRKAYASKHAKAERRWHVLLDAAERGATMEEGARLVGMTVRGVQGALFKHTSSTLWPPRVKQSVLALVEEMD